MFVSIDCYRSIDKIDSLQLSIIDHHWIIKRFSDMDFYRLNTLGVTAYLNADFHNPFFSPVVSRTDLEKPPENLAILKSTWK